MQYKFKVGDLVYYDGLFRSDENDLEIGIIVKLCELHKVEITPRYHVYWIKGLGEGEIHTTYETSIERLK